MFTTTKGAMMATRISRGNKRIAIAIAVVLTFTSAGAAFAYWTSTGTGTGEATTAVASEAFEITSDPPVGTIAPGSAGQTVAFTVTNPGPGDLNLSDVTVTIATTDGVAWVPTGSCLLADYSVALSTAPVYGVIAPSGSLSGEVTVTLANTGVNQDDCQGQAVPLWFVAS
jgi:hypothetical protein